MSIYSELEIKEYENDKNRDSELFDKMNFLYPNLTYEEYKEELEREGYESLNQRIDINVKSRYKMIEKYGGDGLGQLRKYYIMYLNGRLDPKPSLPKKKNELWKKFFESP